MIGNAKHQSVKRKPEPVYLRVIQNGLVPADGYAQSQLRNKKLKIGDVIKVDIRKLRSQKFNRLVHRIGQLCVKNIEQFKNMDPHSAIKRLQLESNAGCEEITISLNTGWSAGNEILRSALILLKDFFFMLAKNAGVKINEDGTVILRMPRSISYESMSQEEYEGVALIICRHVAEVYWSGLGPDQIAEMAESMVDE